MVFQGLFCFDNLWFCELSSGSGTKNYTAGRDRGHHHLRRRLAVPGAHQVRTSEKESAISPPPLRVCSAQLGTLVTGVPGGHTQCPTHLCVPSSRAAQSTEHREGVHTSMLIGRLNKWTHDPIKRQCWPAPHQHLHPTLDQLKKPLSWGRERH